MRDKVYATQKKGVKTNDFYVTKRGFYMDYELKVAKALPSSGNYHLNQSSTKIKNPGTVHRPNWRENFSAKLVPLQNTRFTIECR
jgi:hypothetical protein